MPAWGAYTENREGRWNTDVVTSRISYNENFSMMRALAEVTRTGRITGL
jgi:hypothetical protein